MNDHGRPQVGDATPPFLVEVTRGAMSESRHRVAAAVVDASGAIILAAGDPERPIYARSAIKPIQALALVETGAAEAFGLGDTEIALACASHSGEPAHVRAVRAWLSRIGCSEEDLECGAHPPLYQESADTLVRSGIEPSPIHDNCSGKHAGFLTAARHLGFETRGYIRYDHPVQQRVLGILEQMTGLDLGGAPRGTDGCGIPVIGIPLGNVALAMARLADPSDQPDHRQEACARICSAMVAAPHLVAGTGRFDTRVILAAEGKAVVKGGAEGVHCAAIPGAGVGICVKSEDGAKRAAETIIALLLERYGILKKEPANGIGDLLTPIVYNRAGAEVGCIRVAADKHESTRPRIDHVR